MTQAKIVAKIRKLGYKVTVLNASARNRGGIPDCLLSFAGFGIFLEIKIDKDKTSKLQEFFFEEFNKVSFVLHYDSKQNYYHYIHKPETKVNYINTEIDRFMRILKDELNNAL